jgi:mono/diheme cytochrome c family protein
MRQGLANALVVTASAGLLAVALGSVHTAAQGGGTPAPGAAAAPAETGAGAGAKTTGSVARGKYLVNAMGCDDCHTPTKMGPNGPEPDMSLRLSGHPASMTLPPPPAPVGPWIGATAATTTAFAGPWGISYTRNLTPDKATGLGEWTEQQFVDTIRTGRRQGRGREILPPMPWPAFKNLNDADLKAMFAYLRTIKPIENKVPEPVLAAAPK